MIDIAILSVPGLAVRQPQIAPALLKASVEQAGFSCKTVDFNVRLYTDVENWEALETYFCTGMGDDQEALAEQLVEGWVLELIKLNPKYVGISVFTYQNRIATTLFCKYIRKYSSSKIILGGQGLADGGIGGMMNYPNELQQKGLSDYYIRSEGEVSLVELLKGNFDYPGICSDDFLQIQDLNSLPFPNYDDYNFDQYDVKKIPVIGSRGCVRACSFCDIHAHWKQYKFKSGEKLAEEMIYINERYNIGNFACMDSLINGNLKEFNKLTQILADYNKTATSPISWSSQFIVRSENQVNEQYWQLIAESGGYNLSLGVETGSDSVRSHMNKKFSNEDLDYTMRMLQKYKITTVFLMIVGYPTETDKDFQDTLDMFTRYQPYANTVITDINVGSTLGILANTPLYDNAKEYNIELDKYENNWVALDNPDLTLEKRLERRAKLKAHILSLGYTIKFDSSMHLLQMLENSVETYNKRNTLKKLIRIKHEQ